MEKEIEGNVLYHYEIDGKTFITPSIQLAIKRANGIFDVYVNDEFTTQIEIDSDE